jgi:hypothetical protein
LASSIARNGDHSWESGNRNAHDLSEVLRVRVDGLPFLLRRCACLSSGGGKGVADFFHYIDSIFSTGAFTAGRGVSASCCLH